MMIMSGDDMNTVLDWDMLPLHYGIIACLWIPHLFIADESETFHMIISATLAGIYQSGQQKKIGQPNKTIY